MINGKITYVHRRIWPALVRLAPAFKPERLAALHEVHTASGAHRLLTRPYPEWVLPEVNALAEELSIEEAVRQLGDWASTERQALG